MKNKTLILIISIVSILLIVLLGIRYNFGNTAGKLKSDITYPTSDGLAFSCDKTTINVNEEATCTLVGKITGGVLAVVGRVEIEDGLELVGKITYDEDVWNRMGDLPDVNFMQKEAVKTAEQFTIVTLKVKGTAAGSPKIKFVKTDEEESVYVDTGSKTELSDTIQQITVTDSSSGDGDDDPELSSINTLETLTVSPGTLSPTFGRTTYDYEVIVPNNATQIVINGTATDSANSEVDGFDTYNLSDLTVGNEKDITITVIAQNGDRQEYNVTVRRQAQDDPTKSSDNTLKGLSISGVVLSPAFSSSITEYSAEVENSVTNIEVTAEVNDSNATVDVDVPDTLSEGNNTITITVTAENDQIKIYTIVVNRKSKGSDVCVLELKSTAYKIDNTRQIIDAVNKDDTDETIRKNITATCGSFSVSGDKVVLANGDNVKTYTINRVFVPKTGQNPIKYVAIILGIVLIIGILIFVKKKMDK